MKNNNLSYTTTIFQNKLSIRQNGNLFTVLTTGASELQEYQQETMLFPPFPLWQLSTREPAIFTCKATCSTQQFNNISVIADTYPTFRYVPVVVSATGPSLPFLSLRFKSSSNPLITQLKLLPTYVLTISAVSQVSVKFFQETSSSETTLSHSINRTKEQVFQDKQNPHKNISQMHYK